MIHNLLNGRKVVLASASPRRRQIFEMLGIQALVVPSHAEENSDETNPRKLVMHHAQVKARDVADRMDDDCIIVGADTIVYHRREILGKPQDEAQAADYLSRLSGDSHCVYTGVCVICGRKTQIDCARSTVRFSLLTPQEIEEYIATREPMDKAGAYGIQGYGSQLIEHITGCYFNVMGFPVALFYELLQKLLRRNVI